MLFFFGGWFSYTAVENLGAWWPLIAGRGGGMVEMARKGPVSLKVCELLSKRIALWCLYSALPLAVP